jgi:lactoylglutathione lyase
MTHNSPITSTSTPVQTPITGVFTVGVPVTDQDRALAFYAGVLGFDTVLDVPLPQLGGRWIVVAPVGATTTLALVPATDAQPAGRETGIRLATADAAGLHAELAERSVSVGELLRWPGVPPMFAVHDPDGNGLSVTEAAETGGGAGR